MPRSNHSDGSSKSGSSRSLTSPFAADSRVPQSEQMHLQWDHLSFSVKEKKHTTTILDSISSELRPGELTAIMGPSGAGKSTLLNALAGRAPYGTLKGTIKLNGEKVSPLSYRTKMAYVMQQDALFPTQTVEECLQFTARLRHPTSTEEELNEIVDSAIETLGLQRCRTTLIGSDMLPGVSGGEKKRVAVAVELLSSPALIFLDEPTSGLDSHSALELVKTLRRLALSGCTIICTIHQPSSEVFELFQRVILLRKGRQVFDGNVTDLVPHFAEAGYICKDNYNPSDFAMFQLQTLSDEEVAPLLRVISPKRAAIEKIGADVEEGRLARPPLMLQITQLAKREAKMYLRDKTAFLAGYIVGILLTAITSLIFFQVGKEWGDDNDPDDILQSASDHRQAVAFVVLNCMFFAAQPILMSFPTQRPVFLREYTSGTYSSFAYVAAKTVVEIPTHILTGVTCTFVAYFLVGLNALFPLLALNTALLCIVSASTSFLLAGVVSNAQTAVNMLPATFVPQIMLSGFFVSIDSVPVWMRWMQYLCPLRYSVSATLCLEFAGPAVPSDRSAIVDTLIEGNGVNRDLWYWYVIMMFVFFVVLRTATAYVLTVKAKNFQ
eukprot:TRINITY_DN302_c2_g1_i2.p2 TRINITY_DN302_c2_g1~~TRINITY_DN302_c2_g1_i2.p2  ORF type:complete len:608 (+),score=121.19 TRINITY_DN302_c2_g1_i2:3393-5216(+)